MKKLFLHIGLGKTGSSALQSWLSLNTEALKRQGIDYADLKPHDKLGENPSGNGTVLFEAIRARNFGHVEELIKRNYFYSEGSQTAIISSELLQNIWPHKLKKIEDICQRNNVEVTVIAYIRSIYEGAYSAYGQLVKMSGESSDFSVDHVEDYMAATLRNLRRYSDHFGNRIILLNYDDPDHDIYTAFCASIRVSTSKMQATEKRINRSLSHTELKVQKQLNVLHGGNFSAPISKYMAGLSPNKSTSIYYDAVIMSALSDQIKRDIEWINERFQLTPSLTLYSCNKKSSRHSPEHVGDIMQSIADWALTYVPKEALRREFGEYLAKFSSILYEYSMEASKRVAVRSQEIQKGDLR